MACPRCGDVCHCSAGVRLPNGSQLRARFEVDSEASTPSMLVDPERYEGTEEQFSASLESPAPSARFIPDPPRADLQIDEPGPAVPPGESSAERNLPDTTVSVEEAAGAPTSDRGASEPGRGALTAVAQPSANPDAWKEELAARLNSYRAKRKPRPPKYPSLSLDFEPAFPPTSASATRSAEVRTSLAIEERRNLPVDTPVQTVRVVPAEEEVSSLASSTLTSGRVIEFPRFFGPEEPSPDQLAEPVCDQPRILDAPEVEMPAPALGGIVLEPKNDGEEAEGRPGFEVPLHSASISRRVAAAAIDLSVTLSAAVMFAYIFLHFVKVLPPLPHVLAPAILLTGMLWGGYQYMLLTYSGTTPGLRLVKLQLCHFDGSAVLRSRRRWRVLASLLSGVSLGLGFVWCFLDEDALCWHDRITRTHLMPRA